MSISMKRTVWGSSPLSSLKKSRTQIKNSELYLHYFYEDGPVGYAMYRLDLTAYCAVPIEITPILELPRTHFPSSMGAFVVGSKIYLIGGEFQLSPGQIQFCHDGIDKPPTKCLSNIVYVYDTAAAPLPGSTPSRLSFGPPMHSGKTLPIIIPVNELIYVLSDLPTFHTYFDEETALFEVFNANANEGRGMWSALVNPPFYPTSRHNYRSEGMIVSHAVVNSKIFVCTSRKDRMYAFRLDFPIWEVFDMHNPNIQRQFPFINGALSISGSVWAATGSCSISPVCTYDFMAEYGFVKRDVEGFPTIISSDPFLAYDVHYQLLDFKNGWYCLLKFGFNCNDEDFRRRKPYVFSSVFHLVEKRTEEVFLNEANPWPAHNKSVNKEWDFKSSIGEIKVFGATDLHSSYFAVGTKSFTSFLVACLPVPAKDITKRRSTDNQGYVLGHKTASIRDIYTLGHKLGQGRFSTTYLCTENATGIEYASKSISKRELISKDDVEDVRREIQIMHHLAGHKNIVTIKGTYEDSLYVHIVMELCGGGDLFDRIIQREHYSEREAAKLTKIIVGVVETCHSLGVMHRDLKPENFLLVNKDDDFSLKAINFGLSVFFKPGQSFTDVVGSPYYVAPEVLSKDYGPVADVWTAGVILYILLSGVPPFLAETQQGIFDTVLKGHIDFESDPWPLISDSAKDLIRKMLCSPPSERLTAHEVLGHPWFCENEVAPDRAPDPAILSRLKQFSAMNKLKRMALRVIAESLSAEKIAGLRVMFEAMDIDNSGTITFDELKAGLRRYGSTFKDMEILDLMAAADMDSNGTIDYMEFIAATVHLNKLEREEHLVAAFRYFDKDGSGYITVDELQQAFAKYEVTYVFLKDIIQEVDQDNDGRIDYQEFVDMMQKGNAGLEDELCETV